MTINVRVQNGDDGTVAKVTSRGQLVTSPLDFSTPIQKDLDLADTAYNFFVPKTNKQFVITGIFAKADQQVSNTVSATVVIYEATSASTTDVSKTIFQTVMLRNDLLVATGMNFLVSNGKWINAKTTDDDIHMTITGYYVDKID